CLPISREDLPERILDPCSHNLREKEEDTIFCWELFLNKIQGKQTRLSMSLKG
ncbi:hypothetical protein M9458_020970, partial [Cirrhinus mrigala]